MPYLKKIKILASIPNTLYHGTSAEFTSLKPNEHGIIWLTDDPEAAKRYARKSPKKLFKVSLHPKKVIDLRDTKDPLVSQYKRAHELDSGRGTEYKIADDKWSSHAGYFLLEKYGIDLFLEHNVDVVITLDASGAYDHLSYAVLNSNCIKVLEVSPF